MHVLLDLRGGANDPVLCTFGEDCQPPFLSRRAYYFLGQSQSVGESVTATAILRAVLAAVFDNPRFDDVRVSLIMPNHPDNAITGGVTGAGGATILAGYSRLGDSREALSRNLQAIPLARLRSRYHCRHRLPLTVYRSGRVSATFWRACPARSNR